MGFGVVNITDFVRHAPTQHHCARQLACLLDVTSRTVGNLIFTVLDNLCRFAGHRHRQTLVAFVLEHVQPVHLRQAHDHT